MMNKVFAHPRLLPTRTVLAVSTLSMTLYRSDRLSTKEANSITGKVERINKLMSKAVKLWWSDRNGELFRRTWLEILERGADLEAERRRLEAMT